MYLNNAQSVNLDFPAGDYEYIHLEGAWAREKHIERNAVHKGTQGFESRRGASGHAENPFLMFFDKGSNEDCGNVLRQRSEHMFQRRLIIRQAGRITPLSMRGTVATNGAFGYELDLSKLNETELDENEKYSVNDEIKSGRTLMNYGIVIDNVERDGDNMIFKLEAV